MFKEKYCDLTTNHTALDVHISSQTKITTKVLNDNGMST